MAKVNLIGQGRVVRFSLDPIFFSLNHYGLSLTEINHSDPRNLIKLGKINPKSQKNIFHVNYKMKKTKSINMKIKKLLEDIF